MNAMGDEPERPEEPPIVLIGLDRRNYYLLKGDEYLNELLVADGTFPKPILCMQFENIIDAKMALGESFSLASLWGVHPDIVARLRDENHLIETDA